MKIKIHNLNQLLNTRNPAFIVIILFLLLFYCQCQTTTVFEKEAFNAVFERYQVQGTFGYLNNASGNFYIHDLSTFRDSPKSVGKSLLLLLDLEAIDVGLLSNTQEKYFSLENHTDSNSSNFLSSDQLLHSIPFLQFRKIQDSLHYGKPFELAQYQTSFVEHHLKLTADEQLGFIKKLYFKQLPFQKRTQDLIKSKFISYTDSIRSYHYFISSEPDSNQTYWIMGWVEEQAHPAFFVLAFNNAPHLKNLAIIPFLKELISNI